ncbi:glycosyltransferase family 39 protein [Phormidium sp. CCY1219]|nr:glycosyltransferase family 39 protein [Phormidium sp. CCY1219]
MRYYREYLLLAGILLLGAGLRFAQLEAKPLWLDEIMTGLFSVGGSYDRVPLDVQLRVGQLADIFTLNSQTSCGQIAQTVATESTHPPLFFCLTHQWLKRVEGSFAWQVRSLSAWFGIVAIAGIYLLNRLAFSARAARVAAALMAVSPFAVYLSQEARHYTLPMVLIILALIGLIEMTKRVFLGKKVPILWGLAWSVINATGLYVHYFFILAFVAQILTLFAVFIFRFRLNWRVCNKIHKNQQTATTTLLKLICFCLLPGLFYWPWLPILLQHFNRPETDWFQPFNPSWTDSITPIFNTLAGWLVMTVALPVENQPLWVAISSGLLMLIFAGWMVGQIAGNFCRLFTTKTTQLSSITLGFFTGFVLLQYFAIVYLLGKDITSAVRYHFMYYPGICALLAASLSGKKPPEKRDTDKGNVSQELPGEGKRVKMRGFRFSGWVFPVILVVLLGAISSSFVVSGLVFQKPYDPQGMARRMNVNFDAPVMVVVGYENYQEVGLGLGLALELERIRAQNPEETWVAFVTRSPSYQSVWEYLAQLGELPAAPLNLWIVAPGLRQRQYPPQLALSKQGVCQLVPTEYYRLGIPYQLYRCERLGKGSSPKGRKTESGIQGIPGARRGDLNGFLVQEKRYKKADF